MLALLLSALLLGLSAGITPGPLFGLTLAETLEHGVRAGLKVAVAPLITDIPVILFTLLILSPFSGARHVLGIISLGGAALLMFLGYRGLRFQAAPTHVGPAGKGSLVRAMLINLLSPYPYLFWLVIGGPILLRALEHSMSRGLLFLASFYLMLVGSKALVAVAAAHSRRFLTGRLYVLSMRSLGVMMCVLAALLLLDALSLLGLLPRSVG